MKRAHVHTLIRGKRKLKHNMQSSDRDVVESNRKGTNTYQPSTTAHTHT